MSNQPDQTTTTLTTIVVEKNNLLEKLNQNRKIHAEVFEAACAGFWIKTQEILEQKKVEFTAAMAATLTVFDKQVSDFGGAIKLKQENDLTHFRSDGSQYNHEWTTTFKTDWKPVYPVNHLEDYDRAIAILQFSIADKVQLSLEDFDAYVRNNWKWKEKFGASNQAYIQCVTGGLFLSGGLTSSIMSVAVSGALARY